MNDYQQLITLRTKKLGVLLYDARLTRHKKADDCAEAMGISSEQYQRYESGQASPSLPEVEALAYFLDIPVEHFWGDRSLSVTSVKEAEVTVQKLRDIRNRIVGTRLRMARTEIEYSFSQVSEMTGIKVDLLQQYELGEISIPLPELESLADVYKLRLDDLLDQQGPIGEWRSKQHSIQQFLALPVEMQQFITKPVNKPYIELAMRLSQLSAERLRLVAESLLEITY